MDIVIAGAGEVGRHTAEVLSPAGHNITVVDRNEALLATLDEQLDVRSYLGDATHAHALSEAGVASTDLFVAATENDHTNLLSASIAKGLGAAATIARVHHSAFFDRRGLDYAKHLGIDHLVCPEHTTAQAIASALRSPGALAIEQFAKGKIQMQALPVQPQVKAIGTSLRQLELPAACRVAVIRRGDMAILPTAETTLDKGDVVTVIGEAGTFDKVSALFTGGTEQRLKVVLMGGSTQAVWVCRALRHRRFAVRLFVPERERAEELSEKLDWVTVLNEEVISAEAMASERIGKADAFIAATDDDESNVLACAMAKSVGASMVVAVQQRGTYLHLMEHVGIDKAFSPRITAVTEITRLMARGAIRKLAPLAEGYAEVFALRVPDTATKAVGKPLHELELPQHAMLAVIQREAEVFVPLATSTVEPGDVLIVIAPESAAKPLGRMFAA